MVFQVSIGFSDLVNDQAKDDESRKYALFIGDTIQVNKDEAATVFTVPKKKIENVGIFIKVSGMANQFVGSYLISRITPSKIKKAEEEKDNEDSEAEEKNKNTAVEILSKATRGAVLQNKTRVCILTII